MRSLPKTFFVFLAVISLLSLLAYSPQHTLAQEEDFTEEEEIVEEEEVLEEEEVVEEEVVEEVVEEENTEGEVLGGATELGDTGAEDYIYVVAGLVGVLVVAAGFKIARSNVEEY